LICGADDSKVPERKIMGNKYYIIAFSILILAATIIGCDINRKNKVEDAKQSKISLEKEQAQQIGEWKKFKKDADLKIVINKKSIDEFKLQIKRSGNKVKAKYDNVVAVLEQKNIWLKEKASEYKYEGKDKWEDYKIGFNRDMDDVRKALRDMFIEID
jgi:hypothetical protein